MMIYFSAIKNLKLIRYISAFHLTWETILFLTFFVAQSLTNRLLYIGIILLVYLISLYFVSKNLTRTLWIALLSAALLLPARHFTFPYSTPISGPVEAFQEYSFGFADGLVLLLLYSFKRTKTKNITTFSLVDYLFIALMAICFLSSSTSNYPLISWYYSLQLFKLILIFYFSRILLTQKELKTITLQIIMLFITLNGTLMLFEKIQGQPLGLTIEDLSYQYGIYAQEDHGLYRPSGMLPDPNLAASLMSLGLLFFLPYLASTSKFFHHNLDRILFFIILAALIVTMSRGNWLIVILVSFAIFVKQFRQTMIRVNPLKHGRSAIIISLFILIFGGLIINRFQQLKTEKGQSSISTRFRHIEIASKFALQRPWGVGMNAFQYQIMSSYSPEYYLFDSTPAHNLLAELGADIGVGGLAIFVIIMYLILRKNLINIPKLSNNYQTQKMGLLLMCISYLLSAQMYPLFFSNQISIIFWIALGAIYE